MESLEQRTLLTAGVALDPTFGQGGLVTTDQLGISSDAATNIAITEPGGKILVAGNATQSYDGSHFLLARYNADGTLDASFGDGGFVTTTLGYNWNAHGMAVDGSGGIVVVGDADANGQEAAVAKYHADGSLDQSFGSGGIVTINFGGTISIARGVAIDSAGNVDIVGEVFHNPVATGGYQMVVARLKPDGSPDAAFDNNASAAVASMTNTAVTPVRRAISGNAVTIDAAGNLVVAGLYASTTSGQALVARFTNSGTIDPTFNGTGYATASLGAFDAQATAVAIDGNQDIVIAGGAAANQYQQSSIGLARFTPLGLPDASFGTGGQVTNVVAGNAAGGLAIDSAGNILVAAQMRYSTFAALRYTPAGAPDSNFGTGGEADYSFGSSYTPKGAIGVALTSAGQVVLADQVQDSLNLQHLALARLNDNGSVDNSFGSNQTGTVTSAFQISVLNGARAMAIESDGKIVTAGSAWPSTGRMFSVSRYNADGTLDTTFGNGGSVDTDMTGTYPKYDNYANAIAVDAQQRIIAAGQVNHPGGGMDIAIARYEPNGDLDTSFGNGGIVITSLNPYGNNSANAVMVEDNGDILVAGVTSQPQNLTTSNFALLRYTSDGQLDPTFGGAALGGGPGWVTTDFYGRHDIAEAMLLQPDGKIVLAGSANAIHTSGAGDDFALARYNSDGSLDTTFGAGTGKVTTDFGPNGYTNATDVIHAVTLDGQGRIVAAGVSNAADFGFNHFALSRYNSDGTLDSTFGSGGTALTKASTYGNSFADSVIVTPAGKILAGGDGDVAGQNTNFMIARYNDDGSLDSTFAPLSSASPAGVYNTDFGGGNLGQDQIYGMALDHTGRLVAAGGIFRAASDFDTGLARYVLDSTLTANAGGPYDLNEGDSLTLAATASGGDGGALSYSWDVNGDGVFGDATGSAPTLTWQQLEALSPPINDGPATFQVSVRVSDAHGEYVVSTPVTLTLHDVPPTASVSGPSVEVVGQPQAFTLSASDPSPVDTAAGFSFLVDWGDGSAQQTVSAADAALPVSHVFAHSGSFTVSVWAVDKDGSQSASPATFDAVVSSAAMEGTTLVAGGNNIVLQPADAQGGISVTVDGSPQGIFTPTGQIVVYGLAGGDNIQLLGGYLDHRHADHDPTQIAVPAVIFGGAGDDTIDARGSSANNVLVGASGNDVLYGGSGRNLLIGGGGSDRLYAGGDGDILIGGTTDYDANLAALNAIMAEWGRTDLSYDQRIAHLDGSTPGGLNLAYFLNAATVHDDGGSDELVGARGLDWYFAGADDVIVHKRLREMVTAI